MEKTRESIDLASMTREELKQYAEKVSAEKSALQTEIAELSVRLHWYEEQFRLSRRKRFGASSEKTDVEQMSFFNEAESESDETAAEPEMTDVRPRRGVTGKKQKGRKEKITKALPKEVIEYKLDGEERICPVCGNELHVMKKEVRKELVVIPAKVKTVEHVTYSYACRNCENTGTEATIRKAPSPAPVLRNSLVSASFLADVLTKKYRDALPLYRQEQEWKRRGIQLSRTTLANWVIHGALTYLKPLYQQMHEDLLRKNILHADETELEVLREPGRKAEQKSYMWIYRTSGCDSDAPIILFDYRDSRSGRCPEEFLRGFCGYLQTDGYAGYHTVTTRPEIGPPAVLSVGCLAHARRKYVEARKAMPKDANPKTAVSAVGQNYCNQLFDIERQADEAGLSFEERKNLRETKARPVWEAFLEWAKTEQTHASPKSKLAEALKYTLNQSESLQRYLMDGRLEISNNRAERSIKPFVIGRKNWLFSNTPKGARASAVIYSIVETAKECSLDLFRYFEYIFEVMPSMDRTDKEQLRKLLPYASELPEFCRLRGKEENLTEESSVDG